MLVREEASSIGLTARACVRIPPTNDRDRRLGNADRITSNHGHVGRYATHVWAGALLRPGDWIWSWDPWPSTRPAGSSKATDAIRSIPTNPDHGAAPL
jgi:hypothetical protein